MLMEYYSLIARYLEADNLESICQYSFCIVYGLRGQLFDDSIIKVNLYTDRGQLTIILACERLYTF